MYKFQKKDISFIKNLFLTTVLGGVVGVLNYLFNIFVVRYTSQEIFSTFSAALGIIYIVQIPGTSIQALITKTVAKNKEKNLSYYKWNSLLVFSLIGLISSVIFFFSKTPISILASIPTDIVIYLAITLLFSFVSPIAKGFLLGKEKIVTVNLLMLLETILKFGIGAIAIKLGGNISLLILANSVPAILTTLFVLPMLKVKKDGEHIKNNFKELILITLFMLLLTMPYTIDLVLVNESFRAEYASVSLLGKLVYFACIMTASVMFARLSNEEKKEGQKKSLLISLLLAFCIGAFISLVYFFFSNEVISLTVGSQYMTVDKYLGTFGLCMTGFALVYMVANYFISQGIYRYLYILLFVSILQVSLFIFRNNSLENVMQNQILVYIMLVVLTFVFLIFNFKENSYEGKKD